MLRHGVVSQDRQAIQITSLSLEISGVVWKKRFTFRIYQWMLALASEAHFYSFHLGRGELTLNVFKRHHASGDLTGVRCARDDIYLLFYSFCASRILMHWPFYRICMRPMTARPRHLIWHFCCLFQNWLDPSKEIKKQIRGTYNENQTLRLCNLIRVWSMCVCY